MKLEQLEKKYKEEQSLIAKKRKNKEFKSKEEDMAVQEESWKNYLIERYKITHNDKDKMKIVSYFQEKAKSAYIKVRDEFVNENKSIKDYEKSVVDVMENYESSLVDLGIISKKTEKVKRKEYVDDSLQSLKENDNFISLAKSCIKQTPVAEKYFLHVDYENNKKT